jgi:cation diffusion facilitator CzcD-associated flavoprotein CzcO
MAHTNGTSDHTAIHGTAILGAGLGGLGMAMRLRAAGDESFIILEKADRVGGTWRDNVYPGAACDVQSHLYWFSFDRQPDWSRLYPLQPEIQANIERLTAEHGIAPHVRFNTEVVEVRWEQDAALWRLRSAAGDEFRARTVIAAWGQLNRPKFGVPGAEDFAGDWFHSARWRHDVALDGRRVACVGSGPSAAQLIPEIAREAARLLVFQRSPNYVVPRLYRPYDEAERRMFLAEPERYFESREGFYQEHETWHGAMRQGTETAAAFTAAARAQLEMQVADPVLRERLWPDYPIGCKRIIISDDFYPALVRPNVELVTHAIARIEPSGIRTADGRLHELDVIAYATGFETNSFLGPVEIVGRSGQALSEAWRNGPEAYLGMSIAGFPNFFMLYGPNTNLGHNSILLMLECQYDYVLQAMQASREAGHALDIRPEVMASFNRDLQDALRGSSFAGQCNS